MASAVAPLPAAQRRPTLRWGDAELTYIRYEFESSTVHNAVFFLDEGHSHRAPRFGYFSPQSASLATIARTGLLTPAIGGSLAESDSTDGVPDAEVVPILAGVVPGTVASVTLRFPARRFQGRRFAAASVTARVTDDMFAVTVADLYQRGGWPATEVWHASSGAVIKTVQETPLRSALGP